MFIDASHPANEGILTRLRAQAPAARPLTPAADAHDPYYEAGCHPDVVEFLWERLPSQARDLHQCLVFGTVCLVQPRSGIILAAGMGTQYVMRLAPDVLPVALAAGCGPVHRWGRDGDTTDLRTMYGPDWVFGEYSARASAWCAETSRHFDAAPAADATLITSDTAPAARPGGVVLEVAVAPHYEPKVVATDPDPERVESVIRGLDWKTMTFVVLRMHADRSLELSGSVEDGLSLVAMDGTDERVSSEPPTLDEAVGVLRACAAGGDWRSLVEWD